MLSSLEIKKDASKPSGSAQSALKSPDSPNSQQEYCSSQEKVGNDVVEAVEDKKSDEIRVVKSR